MIGVSEGVKVVEAFGVVEVNILILSVEMIRLVGVVWLVRVVWSKRSQVPPPPPPGRVPPYDHAALRLVKMRQ